MNGRLFLDDVVLQLEKLEKLAAGAIAQVSEDELFRRPDPGSNSIALVMKHLAGNMRSRWTDFLTTDGEKPTRRRDAEFEEEPEDPATIRAEWDAAWRLALATIRSLAPEDLERTVTIRGEPHLVLQAIDRQLTHYAYHVGQIVFLAKHLAGESFRSLSIPRGRSRDVEVAKDGSAYRPPK